MCDDEYEFGYDGGYDSGYNEGYQSGRDSQEWYIDDLLDERNKLEDEVNDLVRRLDNEQARSQRLGVALLATGLPSHFVDAIADGQ